MPDFTFHAKHAFLTYPQCDIPARDALLLLTGICGARWAFISVGHEQHQDGRDHLHALIAFKVGCVSQPVSLCHLTYVIYFSESSRLGTDDTSISSSEDEDFIPTSKGRATSQRSTTTLQRTETLPRRVINPPAFYLQGNQSLPRETPPSLRWTVSPTQSRISCPNCGKGIHMNFTPAVTPSAPWLNRQSATVGNTNPNTRETVSNYRGRYKTGWTRSLNKRYGCANRLRRSVLNRLFAGPL